MLMKLRAWGYWRDGEASCSNKKPKETKENKERLAKSKEDKRGIKDKKSKSGNVEDPSKERKSKRRRDLNGRWKLLKLGKKISHLIKNHELKEGNPLGCLIFFLLDNALNEHICREEERRAIREKSKEKQWLSDFCIRHSLIYAHGEVECAIHWLLVLIIQSRTICVTLKISFKNVMLSRVLDPITNKPLSSFTYKLYCLVLISVRPN